MLVSQGQHLDPFTCSMASNQRYNYVSFYLYWDFSYYAQLLNLWQVIACQDGQQATCFYLFLF